MTRYVDPKDLEGQPLITKVIGDNDNSVRVAGMSCGRILAKPIAGGEVVWLWSITAPYIPVELLPSHGDAVKLDKAKTPRMQMWDGAKTKRKPSDDKNARERPLISHVPRNSVSTLDRGLTTPSAFT